VSIIRKRGDENAELVQRAMAGDLEAFDLLVDHYTPDLYRVVRRMASDQGEAEEIVQEAWLRVWRAFPRYESDRPLINWLMRIAVNVARDRWRKKKPLDFADLGGSEVDVPDLGPGPEERLTRKEALEHLIRGVERLRPEHRMVVALRYDAGYSYKEIAAMLDVPLNTVRTHLRRAKDALRIWMEVENDHLAG
jgi:RNA polymerase sigma-70 factor (ECF subfamily)